jgi:hypothetical protein
VTEEQATTEIMNRFATQWAALEPTIPFQVENVAFTEPTPGPTVSWTRCTIVWNTPIKETLGLKCRIRHSGTIYVQIFGPLGRGTNPNAKLMGRTREIFQLKDFGPSGNQVHTHVTAHDGSGNEGRWYMSTSATPFYYYEYT